MTMGIDEDEDEIREGRTWMIGVQTCTTARRRPDLIHHRERARTGASPGWGLPEDSPSRRLGARRLACPMPLPAGSSHTCTVGRCPLDYEAARNFSLSRIREFFERQF